MQRRRLSRRARIRVQYDDQTRYGSALTDRADELLRQAAPNILEWYEAHGLRETVRRGSHLLDEAGKNNILFAGRGPLPEEFLYPDPALVTPSSLAFDLANQEVLVLPIAAGESPAELCGRLQRGEPTRHDAALEAAKLFEELVEDPPSEKYLWPVKLVGHATVRLADRNDHLLVDPFFLPAEKNKYGLEPLAHADFPNITAIFITHSHPDHFDPGTLVRFGEELPIYVPEVERESMLAIDMAARLEQLGFQQVVRLRAGQDFTLGDIRVQTFPFFGEQPAVSEVLHPEVRNIGLTYVFEVSGDRIGVVADSGRDPSGELGKFARADRRENGGLNLLFAGYRGFALYPLHYLFSSVARFLPFVPRELWTVRQKIMNDANDALDLAESWGARAVVPYADGGAPWYWEQGLGPALDGARPPIPSVDPAPEDVQLAARARSGSQSGLIDAVVWVVVLRPGDEVCFHPLSVSSQGPWPYGRVETHPHAATRAGETFAVTKKKILLRILAKKEGVEVTEEEVKEALNVFRREFEFLSVADTQKFLQLVGVTFEQLVDFVRDGVIVEKVLAAHGEEVGALLDAQISIGEARLITLGKSKK